MTEDIKNILLKIINKGYEAYIVGGYVRDYILGIESTDVDICTNALPKDLAKIFENDNIKISTYGSVKLRTNKYNVDITTYRKELKYENGKPTKIEYIDDLETDIKRRDFTINALYMDINGQIIDRINGMKDINNKIIRVIGNVNDKFNEDPVRILRALRLKICLNFDLDSEIIKYIHLNKKSILKVSNNLKKEEISKMLLSKNVVEGFNALKDMQILDILDINYKTLKYVEDINGMYAQLSLPDSFPLTKEEKDNIEAINEIVKYGKIDNKMIFKYDLYLCLVAGELMGLNKKEINEIYIKMPIKNSKELNIDGDEIQMILNIKPSKIIKNIRDSLINLILAGKLENKKEDLIKFIINNKGMWL